MSQVADKLVALAAAAFIAIINMIWIWLYNVLVAETSLGFDLGFFLVTFTISVWILSAITSGRSDYETQLEFELEPVQTLIDVCRIGLHPS